MGFKSRLLTRGTKVMMYQTLGRLVLMCGSETWTLKRSNELRMCTSERKILRTVNGPVHEKGEWSTRCSQELYHLQRSLCRSCKVAMGRAPAKWPIITLYKMYMTVKHTYLFTNDNRSDTFRLEKVIIRLPIEPYIRYIKC